MSLNKLILLVSRLSIFLSILVSFLTVATVTIISYPEILMSKKSQAWKVPDLENDLPEGPDGQLIKYGFLLATETSKWMGPQVKNPANRFSGNNLACKNCHLQAGTQKGSASWIGVPHRFPQFRDRENKVGRIEDRVNGCMERSMNGRKLPDDSKQMEAIIAYMNWISKGLPEEKIEDFVGFVDLKIPAIPADTIAGREIYETECTSCHGKNGEGVRHSDTSKGYLYPPLWGNDTYNHGAGMHRVLTAAAFIKGSMPFGQASWDNPKLTDEQSYHVAAYINSFPRPSKPNAENDFPDLKLKPVSTPYGPWEDSFSASQHKYGPFLPIISYYKEEHNIIKTK